MAVDGAIIEALSHAELVIRQAELIERLQATVSEQ